MKALLLANALCLLSALGTAQHTDTLRFHSAAFGTEREVVVHLPEFHRYASAEVRLPVIIVLDGQHEWFVQPVVNDIRYLTFTKELPQCITVEVPHADRISECRIPEGEGPEPALLRMLVDELPGLLQPYHPSGFQLLIGHSFAASFALYAFAQHPERFPVVLAHTPGNGSDGHLARVRQRLQEDPHRAVYLSVGGPELQKDKWHHGWVTEALRKEGLPGDLPNFVFREVPHAAHNAVPIRATPEFLSHCFNTFSLRDTLVRVNMNYELEEPPPPVAELLRQIEENLAWRGTTIPWELPEINGMASRIMTGDHPEQLLAVYQRGVELYPSNWEFHAAVGELLLDSDPEKGKASLRRSLALLEEYNKHEPDYLEIKAELEALLE
jgi:predicted alpha/beta superfamily hydrolase